MKKQLLILFLLFVLFGCSSVKKTQVAINNGNYDRAINSAIENLKSNKTKKKNQPYVVMLQDAFKKATERDQEKIEFLKKDANPENLENIYNLLVNLKGRQQKITPLLPLKILKKNKNATFNFKNYDVAIINAKNQLSEYLYANATVLLTSNSKINNRQAYNELKYIEEINPNYKNTRNLIEEAIIAGRDFVYVSMKNETEKVIPNRLEEDLLNFDTYGLNDLWTVYHNKKDTRIQYDFGLELNLRTIDVSPEQVREKQIIKEKQIKSGFKYLLDDKGNQVKDSLGNKIKVDELVNVRCEFYQFTQFKSSKVTGQVKFIDLNSKQLLRVYPIESEFVFEHVYARFDGDKRALEKSLVDLLTLKAISFPTNETMIYDTGTDLKQKLKGIIFRNKFRD